MSNPNSPIQNQNTTPVDNTILDVNGIKIDVKDIVSKKQSGDYMASDYGQLHWSSGDKTKEQLRHELNSITSKVEETEAINNSQNAFWNLGELIYSFLNILCNAFKFALSPCFNWQEE